MDRKSLDQLWAALGAARRCPQTAADLESLAKECGRKLRTGGKHPMWISDFPHRPLPIPRHGGNSPLGKHAQKVVLNALEADATAWEELLAAAERLSNADGGQNGTK